MSVLELLNNIYDIRDIYHRGLTLVKHTEECYSDDETLDYGIDQVKDGLNEINKGMKVLFEKTYNPMPKAAEAEYEPEMDL